MGGVVVGLGVLAAVLLGGLAGVLAGLPAGLLAAAVVLGAAVAGQRAGGRARRAVGAALLLATLLGGTALALAVISVVEALRPGVAAADAADAAALAEAQAAIAATDRAGAFRLELTEAQLQAVVQEGIAADPDLPVRRLDLDLRPPPAGAQEAGAPAGTVRYTAAFRTGELTAEGEASIAARDGGLALELGAVRVGGVRLPAVVRGALGSVLSAVTDLNAALAGAGTVVEAVEVRDDRLVVVGRRPGGAPGEADVLARLRDRAAAGAAGVAAPPEVLGPGRVDAREAPGEPIVLALGDSLAAGVGVPRPREGYVSRFHRAVADRDGVAYGLVNLGVAGETTAGLLHGGQLRDAEAVLAARPAAYVTIDVGANDLLGHLTSAACADDLGAPACQQRIDATLVAYRRDLTVVLDRLVAAAGGARVVLLQVYDPFSLGLGGGDPQQAASEAAVARLNAVAAEVATPRGVLVADGATPMRGTTAATTGMLQPTPDVHPNAAGHDVLATALYRAVGG
jgi:lysophospholipase L1-like esterase